jgi:hypothetical protein
MRLFGWWAMGKEKNMMMGVNYFKCFHQSLLESDQRIVAFAGRAFRQYTQLLWGMMVGIVLTFLVSEG